MSSSRPEQQVHDIVRVAIVLRAIRFPEGFNGVGFTDYDFGKAADKVFMGHGVVTPAGVWVAVSGATARRHWRGEAPPGPETE